MKISMVVAYEATSGGSGAGLLCFRRFWEVTILITITSAHKELRGALLEGERQPSCNFNLLKPLSNLGAILIIYVDIM